MNLKLSKSSGICFFVLMALVLTPTLGLSQQYGDTAQNTQTEVSGEDMKSFANAQIQVSKVRQEYRTRLSNASTQDEQQALIQEMNEKLVAALKDEGLSVEKYNEIFDAVQNDDALRERISDMMQDS
jgi:hypothetical protein